MTAVKRSSDLQKGNIKVDISKIDSNFKSGNAVFEGMTTRNILDGPFEITGVTFDSDRYVRMPGCVAKRVNDGVAQLYTNTSGGRIRFKTDSQRITLTAVLPDISVGTKIPPSGSRCFDMYVGKDYRGFFACDYKEREDGCYRGSATLDLKSREMRDITVNFPLYNNVSAVYISCEEDCALLPPSPEKYPKPIVYYGSSITQGGCASHAGNAYPNIISRRLGTNFINLGFSGSARAESVMMEYLATLDMSIFVYDYDHNAKNYEYLRDTHENGYKIFRRLKPDVPIVMITSADIEKDRSERIDIIRTTYENAKKAGDNNVYFINGDDIYTPDIKAYCTVDKCHPNDFGFWRMAEVIGKVIEKLL